MAVPKRKTSKARRNQRQANWKLSPLNLVKCPKCGAHANPEDEFCMMPHRVCKACGSYANRVVVKVD